MEDIIKEITIDRILSIIGILATIGVAIYIYRVQKKAQTKIEKINNIFDNIAKRRIKWFDGHVGGLLRRLKERSEGLYQSTVVYQRDNSEENLRAVVIAGDNIKSTIGQLASLYERDIELAKNYISDPYMVGKFADVIQVLGWGMDPSESDVRTTDLARLKSNIKERIEEIRGYIHRVEEEVKIINS